MKRILAIILIFNMQCIFSMHEKTPLLTKQNPMTFLSDALHILNKIGNMHDVSIITDSIKTNDNEQINSVVKMYLKSFIDHVSYIKENFVLRDKNGNFHSFLSHKLDPVISLFKEYLASQEKWRDKGKN